MSGTDFYYPNMVELAQKLAAIAPGAQPKRVYFGNSGTEAVEAAIKLARYHTRRDKIIAFYGAFHGRTMGSLSLTASKVKQRKGFGALLAGVFHVPYPNVYRCPEGQTPESYSAECAGFIERELFHKMVDPEEVAAIVIEPIQGEGGYVPAPASNSCSGCKASAEVTASSWSPTKFRAAWAAPASGGPAITPESSQTLFALPRASPLECRFQP